MKDAVDILNQRIAELESILAARPIDVCPCNDETPDPCPECGATVSGNDIVGGVCQAGRKEKEATEILRQRIAELESQNKELRTLHGDGADDETIAKVIEQRQRIAEIGEENKRLREILHTERQGIAKRLDRIKHAVSRLEYAVYDAAMEGE